MVITELSLVAKLSRSGLLKYFKASDICFHITDFCYSHKSFTYNNDKIWAKKMTDEGLLRIVNLNEAQMMRSNGLYLQLKPRFIFKTITAIVVAEDFGYKLVSEDDLLIEVAKSDFNIKCTNKEGLITEIVYEISTMGGEVDLELVKLVVG